MLGILEDYQKEESFRKFRDETSGVLLVGIRSNPAQLELNRDFWFVVERDPG